MIALINFKDCVLCRIPIRLCIKPCGIINIYRVGFGVCVFMKRLRVLLVPLKPIHRSESSSRGVRVSCAVVVEAKVGIKLFARVKVVAVGRADSGNQVAEGVVGIAVRDGGRGVGQLADRAVAVVLVEVDDRAIPCRCEIRSVP